MFNILSERGLEIIVGRYKMILHESSRGSGDWGALINSSTKTLTFDEEVELTKTIFKGLYPKKEYNDYHEIPVITQAHFYRLYKYLMNLNNIIKRRETA